MSNDPTHAVAYIRVSDEKQGKSGLGLDAQRSIVARLCADPQRPLSVVQEFREVETGTRKGRARPELAKALAMCRERKAVLLIPKVDRLARDVAFLLSIVDSGVECVFGDLPQVAGPMGRFILIQMASVAELEAGLISERTKAALAEAKARGTRLGNPRNGPGATHALNGAKATRQAADDFARRVIANIRDAIAQGCGSDSAIARHLNDLGVRSATGETGAWHSKTVRRVLDRATALGL